MADAVYAEPLLYTNWQGRTSGKLASKWQWQNDGLALVVELRPGITMHDGRQVNAPLVASILRESHANVLGFESVTSIEAASDLALVFHLSRPDVFLVDALAATSITDGDIGTGPFKLISREPVIVAERNGAYYGGTPGLARVTVTSYDRQRSAWAALMRGELDMLQETSRESVEFFEGSSEIKTASSIRPFYISLAFNVRRPILRSVEVRTAITEAIDREEIVNVGMRGHAMVAVDPIWPFNWAYSPTARRHVHSTEAANIRLDRSGFPMKVVAPGLMAGRFTLNCIYWKDGPQFERIALILQRQLSTAGIDLHLEPLSMGELRQRMREGDFDSFLMMMTSGRTFRWTHRMWHSRTRAVDRLQDTGYSGADGILDRLRTAQSDAEIRTALADLRNRFYEDVPAAFLAWPETTRAIDSRFFLAPPDDPDIFANVANWRPASEARAAR